MTAILSNVNLTTRMDHMWDVYSDIWFNPCTTFSVWHWKQGDTQNQKADTFSQNDHRRIYWTFLHKHTVQIWTCNWIEKHNVLFYLNVIWYDLNPYLMLERERRVTLSVQQISPGTWALLSSCSDSDSDDFIEVVVNEHYSRNAGNLAADQ